MKAASFLESAARKEPDNSAHSLALGCAYACRAASLSHAYIYRIALAAMRASFPAQLKDWEKERDRLAAKSPAQAQDPAFLKTKPAEPPERVFPTKDDSVPFNLTPAQLSDALNDLNDKALAAWKNGVALSKTPEEVAQAGYISGWGILLLRHCVNRLNWLNRIGEGDECDQDAASQAVKSPLFVVKNLPERTAAVQAFDRAIQAAPTVALYWQAKGDALRADITDRESRKASGGGDTAKNAAVIRTNAYQHAAGLGPTNAASLWYQLYNDIVQGSPVARPGRANEPKDERPRAQEYLHHAQLRDRANAWPLYEEAGLLFRSAPFRLPKPGENRSHTRDDLQNAEARKNGRRAIDLLVQGNQAAQYLYPRYQDSVPNLLAIAWQYDSDVLTEDYRHYERLAGIARSSTNYAAFVTQYDGEKAEGLRAANAIIDMGKKLIGDLTEENEAKRAEKSYFEVNAGVAIARVGYRAAQQVCTLTGDESGAEAMRTESENFQKAASRYENYLRAQTPDYFAAY